MKNETIKTALIGGEELTILPAGTKCYETPHYGNPRTYELVIPATLLSDRHEADAFERGNWNDEGIWQGDVCPSETIKGYDLQKFKFELPADF